MWGGGSGGGEGVGERVHKGGEALGKTTPEDEQLCPDISHTDITVFLSDTELVFHYSV